MYIKLTDYTICFIKEDHLSREKDTVAFALSHKNHSPSYLLSFPNPTLYRFRRVKAAALVVVPAPLLHSNNHLTISIENRKMNVPTIKCSFE